MRWMVLVLLSACVDVGSSGSDSDAACVAPQTEPVAGGIADEPGYGVPVFDPVYGIEIVRVTDNGGEGLIPGTSGARWEDTDIWRHSYGTDQAWNADGTVLYLDRGGLFLDARNDYVSLDYTRPYGQWHWSHADPEQAIEARDDTIRTLNVVTGAVVSSHVLDGYDGARFDTRSAPSYAGDRVAVEAIREADGAAVALVVRPSTGEILHEGVFAHYDLGPGCDVDDLKEVQATVSPSGRYLVLSGCNTVAEHYSDQLHWLEIGSSSGPHKDGYVGEQPPNEGIECPGGHGDLGLDSLGNDIFFGTCKGGGGDPSDAFANTTVHINLNTGDLAQLIDHGTSHASGRSTAMAGHGLGSSFGLDQGIIYRFSLDGPTTPAYLAWTYHQGSSKYYAQTHAVASHDGTRIVFASDWAGVPNVYVADVSGLCPPEAR